MVLLFLLTFFPESKVLPFLLIFLTEGKLLTFLADSIFFLSCRCSSIFLCKELVNISILSAVQLLFFSRFFLFRWQLCWNYYFKFFSRLINAKNLDCSKGAIWSLISKLAVYVTDFWEWAIWGWGALLFIHLTVFFITWHLCEHKKKKKKTT